MEIGRDKERRNEPGAVQLRTSAQGEKAREDAPGEEHEKSRRKNAGRALGFIYDEAEDRVGDPERQQRNQQIRRLRDEVRRTIVGGGPIFGIKAHHEKHEHLGAEGPQPKLHRISREPLIFVLHITIPNQKASSQWTMPL